MTGKGVGWGRALLERLAIRAHDEGIRHFSASLLVENRAMLALFERLGEVHVTGRYGGTEEIDVHLPVSSRRASPSSRGTAYRSERTGGCLDEGSLIGGTRA